jgi:hypothetical protein
VLTASNIRGTQSLDDGDSTSETSVNFYQVTLCNITGQSPTGVIDHLKWVAVGFSGVLCDTLLIDRTVLHQYSLFY